MTEQGVPLVSVVRFMGELSEGGEIRSRFFIPFLNENDSHSHLEISCIFFDAA